MEELAWINRANEVKDSPIAPYIPYLLMASEAKASAGILHDAGPDISSDFTLAHLRKLDVRIPSINSALMGSYVDFIENINAQRNRAAKT